MRGQRITGLRVYADAIENYRGLLGWRFARPCYKCGMRLRVGERKPHLKADHPGRGRRKRGIYLRWTPASQPAPA